MKIQLHIALLCVCSILSTVVLRLYASNVGGGGGGGRPLAEEIIPVELKIRGVGQREIDIIYREGKAYLPVVQMFSFVKIKAEFFPDKSVVKGFFLNPDTMYSVDGMRGVVQIGKRTYQLGAVDYFVTDKDVFILSTLFKPIFGLDFVYNPRRVNVSLTTSLRLPVVAIRERERQRSRFLTFISIPEPSISLPHRRLVLGAGRLDWWVNSNFAKRTVPKGAYYARFGGQLLFGDFQVQVRQQYNKSFDVEMLRGHHRYAFLDNSVIRQIVLGDVITPGVFPLNVLGAEITNRPAARRLFFAREPLSAEVGPSRDVDVYTGAGLHATGRSFADGLFNTDIPLMYGVSGINVRSFDEWGDERSVQYRIIVPTTILPPGELQYSIVAGKIRRLSYHRYGGATLGWGVNNRFTIEGRIEYYDVPKFTRKVYSTLSTVVRVTDGLIGEASVTPYANSMGKLSLVLPTLVGGSLTYTRFGRNFFFNPKQAIEEAEAEVAVPFALDGVYTSIRGGARQTLYHAARERALQLGMSLQFYSVHPSVMTTYSLHNPFWGELIKRWTTTASFDARLRANFVLRLLAQYSHTREEFENASLQFGRSFSNRFTFFLFIERWFIVHHSMIGVRFAYYFPFARVQGTVAKTSGSYFFRSQVSGSTLFSTSTGDIYFQNYPNRVGFGAFVVEPFVDINNNGRRDEGEKPISKIHLNASTQFLRRRLEVVAANQIGMLTALPYQKYTLYVEPQRLENPLWITPFTAMSLITGPNLVHNVKFPVVVGGVIHGIILHRIDRTDHPIENVLVKVRSIANGYERSVKTSITGEYEFVGIPPGRYTVFVDEESLQKLGVRSEPAKREVEVLSKEEGDFVENVDFLLQ